MIKSGKALFIVESVEKIVKFYTEKLGFDVVEIALKPDNQNQFSYAELRKGKCYVIFRAPFVGELAELSMVKGCSGRGAGMYIEMKKGLDKFFDRCEKKGVTIVHQPKKQPWGFIEFMVKDPFGLRLTFSQPVEEGLNLEMMRNFCGLTIDEEELDKGIDKGSELLEKMIHWLKGFGILRRVSKKYVKTWYKRYKSFKDKR